MTGEAATCRQVSRALALMERAGYRTDWMGLTHRPLGARMWECSGPVCGTVRGWLAGMGRDRLDALIGRLSGRAG